MPEMYFLVRWPDGADQRCYSPSTVVEEFFVPGGTYPVAAFLDRSRQALAIASERVRARYGFGCTSAAEQLAEIEAAAAAYPPDATVTVTALTDAHGVATANERKAP
ncbi:MSMEG_0570 family nitrogen starvation response protein [Luedemannella helvata]|uniref:MSMEG_0570 family nitrogen starvation response protein n=1 Tax=Luedemannella helvata TaxID=349315 RepID=A0ABP4VYN5_9ACTN